MLSVALSGGHRLSGPPLDGMPPNMTAAMIRARRREGGRPQVQHRNRVLSRVPGRADIMKVNAPIAIARDEALGRPRRGTRQRHGKTKATTNNDTPPPMSAGRSPPTGSRLRCRAAPRPAGDRPADPLSSISLPKIAPRKNSGKNANTKSAVMHEHVEGRKRWKSAGDHGRQQGHQRRQDDSVPLKARNSTAAAAHDAN